jgi:aryl-alcohol dehydrogenase-like predicted oxidoreductase
MCIYAIWPDSARVLNPRWPRGRPARTSGVYDLSVKYQALGRTGMKVSQLCLGAMMFGAWGEPDHDKAIAIIHRALDSGINFIDTADVYSQGESEAIVGKALAAGRRDKVIVATKFHGPMTLESTYGGPDPNFRGNSRRWIVQEAENSLRRLGTDWIDLYQAHRPDPDTHIEETLSALTDLQQQGKIRAFGTSTFPAHQLVEAQWVAERRSLARFTTEQPPYSIMVRSIEADVLPVAQQYGIGILPWSPLAGGWLTGRYRKNQAVPPSPRFAVLRGAASSEPPPVDPHRLEVAESLALLAEEAGLTLVEMALAFVMRHPAVTAPIIGPRTLEQLDSQLGATDVVLSDEVLDRIDEIVPPGTSVTRGDGLWKPPSLTTKSLRRR